MQKKDVFRSDEENKNTNTNREESTKAIKESDKKGNLISKILSGTEKIIGIRNCFVLTKNLH